MKTSKIPGFHELSINERINAICNFYDLEEKEMLTGNRLSDLGENYVCEFPYALRFASNFKINDIDYLIPMVTEEASVVAGASSGAKKCYDNDGFKSTVDNSGYFGKTMGQIQFIDVDNIEKSKSDILKNKNTLMRKAGKGHKYSKAFDLEVKSFDCELGKMLVVDIYVDPGDSMGAAVASQMAESIGPEISKMISSEYNRGIVSNYSGRLTTTKMKVLIEDLSRKSKTTEKEWDGKKVKDNILWLDRWAKQDVMRAATNNKGIMNGVIGVGRATAQDDRAIESANAVFSNCYPLSSWDADDEYLYGELEMLIPCGTYGGEIKNYPKADFLLKKVLKVESADELAEIMGSVGLANNFAALSMISTIGLSEGHKSHRKVF